MWIVRLETDPGDFLEFRYARREDAERAHWYLSFFHFYREVAKPVNGFKVEPIYRSGVRPPIDDIEAEYQEME